MGTSLLDNDPLDEIIDIIIKHLKAKSVEELIQLAAKNRRLVQQGGKLSEIAAANEELILEIAYEKVDKRALI